jgi:hypothetical protein
MRRAHTISLMGSIVLVAACGERSGTPTSPLLAPGSAVAAHTPPGPADIGVTTTIYDVDSLGASVITRSDDVSDPTFASYSPISGVHGGLTSHVTDAWQLYIGNQTARKLRLMLHDAGLSFANGLYYSSVEVASRCFDPANGTALNIQALAADSSYTNCSLILDFDAGQPKTTYKLAMGPPFANTGRATVKCLTAASGLCTSWTIVPTSGIPKAGVAILTAGNGTTSLDGKSYINSYNIKAVK